VRLLPRALAALLLLAACGPANPPAAPVTVDPLPGPPPARLLHVAQGPDAAEEARRKVHAMLVRVARARGLPVQGEVASRVLDRAGILQQIREHVDKEIPADALEHEGELLAALELVPPGYDFVEGSYKLLGGRIAGFYEPTDKTMYLVDDLDGDEATETLAHELVHALQDQAFRLEPMLGYTPGDGDRSAAVHAVIEGDATSAMLDVVAGSAFKVSEGELRMMLSLSNAASEVAATTPHVLQTSLAAPYADGFAFVQRRRAAGGWPAVDAAIRSPPASTEQLLHDDKYASREPPIAVPVPPITPLGEGFRPVLDDVIGEQGLRLMLEEWTGDRAAEKGAAGWGGDRYVIARRDEPGGGRSLAVGIHVVMDTKRDAAELSEILEKRFGNGCRERTDLGPIAWRRKDRSVVVAAGPYERREKTTTGSGSCAVARKWLDEMLRGGGKP
jgi:hypothetical protein